jgi:transposase-like protein
MLTCPHCGNKVPTKSIFQATGLSGVVCPHCNTSLEPKYWSSALLMAVSWCLAWAVRVLLGRAGVHYPADILVLLVSFVAIYVVLAPVILRLRVKETPGVSLEI